MQNHPVIVFYRCSDLGRAPPRHGRLLPFDLLAAALWIRRAPSLSSLSPTRSLALAFVLHLLPSLPRTRPNLARGIFQIADVLELPGQIEGRIKFRLPSLSLYAKPCFLGSPESSASSSLLRRRPPFVELEFVDVSASPTSPSMLTCAG